MSSLVGSWDIDYAKVGPTWMKQKKILVVKSCFWSKEFSNAEQMVTPACLDSRLPLYIFVYHGS